MADKSHHRFRSHQPLVVLVINDGLVIGNNPFYNFTTDQVIGK